MKVWCVIDGFDYEGENFSSLRVFDSREKAEAAKAVMKKNNRYGYVEMDEREVE